MLTKENGLARARPAQPSRLRHTIQLIQIFGLDSDVLAQAAAVFEADNAADFGEQGVVFAAADVQAGLNAGAALAHDDGAARHQLATEGFHAQPLRVAIAPVAR